MTESAHKRALFTGAGAARLAAMLAAGAIALVSLAGCRAMDRALIFLLQETPTATAAPPESADAPIPERATFAPSPPPSEPVTPADPTPTAAPTITPTMPPTETPTISLLMGPARELLENYSRPERTPHTGGP